MTSSLHVLQTPMSPPSPVASPQEPVEVAKMEVVSDEPLNTSALPSSASTAQQDPTPTSPPAPVEVEDEKVEAQEVSTIQEEIVEEETKAVEHPVYGKGRFIVTSTKDVKLDAVRAVFEDAVVSLLGMSTNSNTAEQPIDSEDTLSGAVGALSRIEYLFNGAPEGAFDPAEYDVVVSIENAIHADKLLETAHVVIHNLKDGTYKHGRYSVHVPGIVGYLDMSDAETPLDYDKRTSGYLVTVGKLIARDNPDVPHTNWTAQFSEERIDRGEQIVRALKAAKDAPAVTKDALPSSHRSSPLPQRTANLAASPASPTPASPPPNKGPTSPAVSPLAAMSPPGSTISSPTASNPLTSPTAQGPGNVSPVATNPPSGSLLTSPSGQGVPSSPGRSPAQNVTSPKSVKSNRSRRSARSPRNPKTPLSPQSQTATPHTATSTSTSTVTSTVTSPTAADPATSTGAAGTSTPADAAGATQGGAARPSGGPNKRRNKKRNRKKGSGRGGQ